MPLDPPELCRELTKLKDDIASLHRQADAVTTTLQAQNEQMALTDAKIGALLEAWETGQGVAKFIKWLAPIVAALAGTASAISAFYIWTKQHIHFTFN